MIKYFNVGISVFPAHAGVILEDLKATGVNARFSRTRGGDPQLTRDYEDKERFFPHTRG